MKELELPEDYFLPALAFVEKHAETIACRIENDNGSGFLIRAGYYENPESVNTGGKHFLEIAIAPKLAQAYGGANDGAGIFTPYTVNIREMMALFQKEGDMTFGTGPSNDGTLRLSGEWDDEWHVTLAFHREPFKDDEDDVKVMMVPSRAS